MSKYILENRLDEVELAKLREWFRAEFAKPGVGPIELHIDCDGGIMYIVCNLIDYVLRNRGEKKVVTYCKVAMSAAALLFLVGDRRVIHSQGRLYFHGVSVTFPVWSIDLQGKVPCKDAEFGWKQQQYAEKFMGQRTSLTASQIETIMRREEGKVFSPRKAMSLGIATEIESSCSQLQLGLDVAA